MQDNKFILKSTYKPTGDQPEAISKLTAGILSGERMQMNIFGKHRPITCLGFVYVMRQDLIRNMCQFMVSQVFPRYS